MYLYFHLSPTPSPPKEIDEFSIAIALPVPILWESEVSKIPFKTMNAYYYLCNMKKRFIYSLLILLPFVMACQPKKASPGKLQLTVSIIPQQQMLEFLSGEQWDVQVLLPPGSNHETYEPTPQDMKKLANSSIYFTLGALDFETTWTERFQASNPSMRIIPTNTGIEMLSGHAHNHENVATNHNHGIDPHIWLSPKCLAIQARNIASALSQADTTHKDIYNRRLQSFINKTDSVDKVIRQILVHSAGKSVLIYHPALAYFAQDYDLHQISIETEGKEPSTAHLIELTKLAKKLNIKAVFISKEFDTRHAEALAKDMNAQVVVYDPMSADWAQNLITLAKLIAKN